MSKVVGIFTKNNFYNLNRCISKTKLRIHFFIFQARPFVDSIIKDGRGAKKKNDLRAQAVALKKPNMRSTPSKTPGVGGLTPNASVKHGKGGGKLVIRTPVLAQGPAKPRKRNTAIVTAVALQKKKVEAISPVEKAANAKFFARKRRINIKARRAPRELNLLDPWIDRRYWRVYSSSRNNAVGRAVRRLKKKHAAHKRKDSFIYASGGEGHNFAENDWRRPDCLLRLVLAGGVRPKHMSSYDHEYVKLFIFQKKRINKLLVPDRTPGRIATYDRIPYKFFYLHYKIDPMFSSFLLDKVINTFTKHGDRKEKVRRLFYEIMRENGYTPDTFYYIVETLRPRFINVIARRGREVYRAPIAASRTKSIMKAIRFFKKAVMSRRYEKTLRQKIEAELREYLGWRGYKNKFFEEYVSVSKASMHLQHFRSKRVY